jgi:hypothetical protein
MANFIQNKYFFHKEWESSLAVFVVRPQAGANWR